MQHIWIILLALFAAWLVAISYRFRGAGVAIVGSLAILILLFNIVTFVWNAAITRAAGVAGAGAAASLRPLAFPGWMGGVSLLALVVLGVLLLLPAVIPLGATPAGKR